MFANPLTSPLNFPTFGPLLKYQEQCYKINQAQQELFKNWLGFCTCFQSFSQVVSRDFPEYLQKTTFSPFQFNLVEFSNAVFRFLDSCWQEVIESEEYSKKSAQLLHSMLQYEQVWEEIYEDWGQKLPTASRRQVEKLANRVQKLQKELRELKNSKEGK